MTKKKSSERPTLKEIVAIEPAVGELIRSARRRTGECDVCRMGLGRQKAVLHPISDFEVDHLHPRAKGGGNEITNLVAICRACNRSKGAKLLEEWRP